MVVMMGGTGVQTAGQAFDIELVTDVIQRNAVCG